VPRSKAFATRGDATRYLARIRTDIDRGDWFDPVAGQQLLAHYAEEWLTSRRVTGRPLAARTSERYASLLRVHIVPVLGHLPLARIDATAVRRWHSGMLKAGVPGPATIAKSYRLLHAILNTAVLDQRIPRNPCKIPGASVERNPERPVASVEQVYALAEAVGERWRALVLLGTFCGLRFGELAGLTRADIDLDLTLISVRADLDELDSGQLQPGDVKSAASRRTVSIPAALLGEVRHHLETYAEPGAEGAIFIGPAGGRLRRGNFRQHVWLPAIQAVGLESFRFHDLRHTGNTLAATTGASTRELMARMGHASARAALIYQHATRDRDVTIAAALSELIDTRRSPGRSWKPSAPSGDLEAHRATRGL
jgi:integrase